MKVRWRFVCWPVAAGLVWAVMAGVAAQSASASGGWVWTETNYNAPSGATTFGWGAASPCRPVSGDFTSTGNSHVGLACYDASTGWTWREDTGSGTGGQVLFGWGGPSGNPPACQPIAGDWAGYGIDHVGLACYSPSSGWTWREDTGSQGGGQILFGWGGADGDPSHCHPITGDWNNYGHDHVGLACWTSSGWTWHEDTGSQGGGAIVFGWGAASDTEADCTAISGNWTGGTQTRVGLGCWTSGGWIWREATGGQGGGQVIFGWGGASSTPPTTIPLTGDWNGDGTTTVATVNSNGLQLNYSGNYVNPLRNVQGLVAQRIDQGVDYAQPGGNAPVYALGNGTVTNLRNSGWPNGVFIVYQLNDGPAQGLYVYVAEDLTVDVSVGEQVTPDTILGRFEAGSDGGYDIETGWADPCSCQTMARTYSQYPQDGDATAFGRNFSQLMTTLGAPPGIIEGPETGTLPSGWPTWP